MENQWRRCNACKNPIEFRTTYWVCSVSTCNRKRTGMAFCSVTCWEIHLPVANHREAWAIEKQAPTSAESEPPAAAPKREPRRIIASAPAPTAEPAGSVPREVLIVASRLKDYVRARAGFNTSDKALMPLSDILRRVVDQAIENARRDERKTLLDRDIPRA